MNESSFKVLSERELSVILGISNWTVRRMRLQEGCPHFTVGSRIFYRLQTVLDWLSVKEQGPKDTVMSGYGVLRRID